MPDFVASVTSRRAVVVGAAAAGAVLTGCSGDDGHRPPPLPPLDLPEPTTRPRGPRNMIVISVDDMGWNDPGCYGNRFNETPHIDALAAEGTRFTRAYSSGPVCSPSRAALVTGQYPGRAGVTDFLRWDDASSLRHVDPAGPSVGRHLRPRGYRSGLIGKWHCTETYEGAERDRPGNPYAMGFDEVIASEQSYVADGDYWAPYDFMPEVKAPEDQYLTDRLTLAAVDFIVRNRQRPFFLHLSNYAVHEALEAKPEAVEEFESKKGVGRRGHRPVFAGALTSIDEQVGRVRETLEKLGLAEHTVVCVTSDNGAMSRAANKPLRGGKGILYEGGIRVPLVAWGPGTVRPGRVEHAVTTTMDLFPTAMDLAGLPAPDGVDGTSLLPVLTGEGEMAEREAMYWAFPHFIGSTTPHAAMRRGRYKIFMDLRNDAVELYDLRADEGEQDDLAGRMPGRARRMRKGLRAHLDGLDLYPPAPVPGAYPDRGRVTIFDADGGAAGWQVDAAGGAALAEEPVGPQTFALVGAGATGEEPVSLGFAQDADNLLLVTHDPHRKSLDWRFVHGGATFDGPRESLTELEGTVDLSAPGAKLVVAVRGKKFAVHLDAGRGWEFLCQVDLGRYWDLSEPEVAATFHPAAAGWRSVQVVRER